MEILGSIGMLMPQRSLVCSVCQIIRQSRPSWRNSSSSGW